MLGNALGAGLADGYQAGVASNEAAERYNPVREALLAQLSGPELTPMQQALASAASDPATFARVMSDPNQLLALQTAGTMATPPAAAPASAIQQESAEMMALFDQAQKFRDAGDTARAGILEGRAMKLAGITPADVQADIEKIRAMGLDPTNGEGYRLLAESISGRAPQTTIQMPNPLNPAASRYGEGIGDRANARVERASAARQSMAGLSRIGQALDEGARTGFGQETILSLKNMAQSLFGMQIPENTADQEVIKSIQAQLMTDFRSTSEGGGLPGATSNRDLQLMATAVPGLGQTPDGNRAIIEYMTAANQLQIDIAREQQRIVDANNGVPPSNLDSMLDEFTANHQVLTPAQRTRYEAAVRSAPPAPAAPPPGGVGGTIPADDVVAQARAYVQRSSGAR